jgi:hypothetical protein
VRKRAPRETKRRQAAENNRVATETQRAQSKSRAELADRYPTPRCICVNAVDKGVRQRFGVKAVDKGLRLEARADRGSVAGKWRGRTGDTVGRTLTKEYRDRVYLSSDKLNPVD